MSTHTAEMLAQSARHSRASCDSALLLLDHSWIRAASASLRARPESFFSIFARLAKNMAGFTDLPAELIQHICGDLHLPIDVSALLRTCRTTRQALGSWPYPTGESPNCIDEALKYAIDHDSVAVFNLVVNLDEMQLNLFSSTKLLPLLQRALQSGRVGMLKRLLEQPHATNALHELREACKKGNSVSLLGTAAYLGNVEAVEHLLTLPTTDVDLLSGSLGATALHLALFSKGKNIHIIRMLIEAGADVDRLARHGVKSPLDQAVASNNVEGLRVLLEAGAAVEKQHLAHGPPTSVFASLNWQGSDAAEIASLLLKYGASASGRRGDSCRPLQRAMVEGRDDIVALLLRYRADVFTASHKNWRSGLEFVFQHCSVKTCKLFLEHGAIRRGMRCVEQTVQQSAALSGDAEKLEWVLDDREFDKTLPRHWLKAPSSTELLGSAGSPRVAELLMRRGADPGAALAERSSFLRDMLKNKSRPRREIEETMRSLLAHGATANMTEKQKEDVLKDHMDHTRRNVIIPILIESGLEVSGAVKTRLLLECLRDCYAEKFVKGLVRPLIDWGADIDAVDGQGRTAVRLAMARHNYVILETLLDLGADYKAIDDSGNTVLHGIYADKTNLEVRLVRRLLRLGVDPNAANSMGLIPLDIALRYGTRKLIKVYLEHGTDIHSLRMMGGTNAVMMSTVHLAAVVSDPHRLRTLLLLGADVNGKDEKGRTPLHWARSKNLARHVRLLKRAGANVDAQDDAGNVARSVGPGLYPDLDRDFDLPV